MSTYNAKIKIVSAKPRSKRLRDTGGIVSTTSTSREVVAAPSVDLSRYCLKDTFDDLFAKVNLGTADAPHWAIKAKYNLYSVGWLSFNGANIGTGSGGDTPIVGAQNLADLKDVSLGDVLPGQVLSWNGNKWVNSTLATSGFDELQLSQYLSSHNYVQNSDLAGYATESWVLQKLQSIGADDLFEKVNLGTDAAPVWAIKAKYNLYSVGWLSFRGPNTGGDGSGNVLPTIASNLADLGDVDLGTLAPGQVLAWSGTKWTNTTPVTSGLDEASLADYLAAHDYATHQWVNAQGFLKQHQSLAGYATESWVNAQGFLKQHQSLAAYLKIDGSNGTHDGVTALIKCLGDATADITDTTKLVTSDIAGDGGVFKYFRRPATAMWAYIGAKVAGSYYNKTQIDATLGNYYNKTQVDTALAGKLDKTTFDDLFAKVNLGTASAPVWAIKAKYNLYSVGWLSFNGANAGDGTPVSFGLGNLSDVLLSTPVAGQSLVYNGTKWVNATLATSGLDEASLADYLTSHGYATQAWTSGAFVSKSGDTINGWLDVNGTSPTPICVCNTAANAPEVGIAFKFGTTSKGWVGYSGGRIELYSYASAAYLGIKDDGTPVYNTHTLLHTGNYTSTLDSRYVLKSGDTMTGRLLISTNGKTLKLGSVNASWAHYETDAPSGHWFNTNVSVQGEIYAGAAYNQKVWHAGNDGSGSGLDADLLDGVQGDWYFKRQGRLGAYNIDTLNEFASRDIQPASEVAITGTKPFENSWGTLLTFKSLVNNGGIQLAANSSYLYFRCRYNATFEGVAWGRIATADGTVANAESLGGIAAGDYVTRISDQTISGVKTFTTYVKHTMPVMFKPDGITDGLYLLPNNAGGININAHKSWSHTASVAQITNAGGFVGSSFIRTGGTASQFLMADGTVNAKISATAPTTLNWQNNTVGNSSIPTMGLLAYWDGRYSATANTSSNLKYCNQGAFGSACTYSEAQFARALSGEEPPTGDINSFWGNRCVLGSINIDANAPGGNGWYNIVQVAHRNGAADGARYVGQIALGMTVNLDQMYYRGHRTRAWQHVLTEQNYAGYLDTHFVTLATAQTISGFKTVTGVSGTGANGFNVGMRFSNSLHQGIEVESNGYTMGIGCHSNGSWYWWYGNSAGKNYCMVYNGALWSFHGQMLVGQSAHITPQYISFNRNNATGAIYDSTKHGAQIGINNSIGGIEFATHTGTAASYAIRMLIGSNTGNVGFGTTSPQYKVHAVGDILSDGGWLRTNGVHGWYNNTYGGGWWMQNSSYIENYGSKRLKITGINDYYAIWIAGGGLCCEGFQGTSWGNGHAAVNVGIYNNNAQTPLLMAYRVAGGTTGASRLFSMEFLNTGTVLYYSFGGTMKYSMTNTGEFYASTGIWTDGYLSFKGQNTTSDARFKDIQGRITLPLTVIANAPSIIYRWVDNGKIDMGSIAQYWQRYLPLAVSTNPLGRLGMDYSKIALASAISIAQSLMTTQDDVAILKADVKRLTAENQQLKTEISQLKTKMAA